MPTNMDWTHWAMVLLSETINNGFCAVLYAIRRLWWNFSRLEWFLLKEFCFSIVLMSRYANKCVVFFFGGKSGVTDQCSIYKLNLHVQQVYISCSETHTADCSQIL